MPQLLDNMTAPEQAMLERIFEEVNSSLLAEAEPIIQKALKDIEESMRRELAKHVVGFIESEYSVMKQGTQILIRIGK